MISGTIGNFETAIDLASLGIEFTSKPIIHGGTAMEYYGLRRRGADFDFIISNDDYQALARKYPANKKDMWGDLGILVGQNELFRSIYRFDYGFFSEGAIEFENFKVISFEKLFFLKSLSFKTSPDVQKLTYDYELMLNYLDAYRNREFVANAEKHIEDYISALNGTIYNDNYKS